MDNLYNQLYLKDLDNCVKSIKNIKKLESKTILVTGAAGLVGSYVVDVLMYASEKMQMDIGVIAIGRDMGRLLKRFKHYQGRTKLQCVEHDVNDPMQKDYKVDYIIHAAGNAYPAAFIKDPVGTIMTNVVGTSNLLNYARQYSIERLLFISSGEVYGKCNENIKAFNEDFMGYVNPIEWRSCYPLAKRMAENECMAYHKQYGCNVVIARLCHTYGPNVTDRDNRASAQFIRNAISNKDIRLKSAGTQVRSYCYIADCVSAIITVLLNGETAQAYNIANRKSTITVRQFAEIAASIVGREVIDVIPNQDEKEQQTSIEYAVLDTERIESLGWKGSFDAVNGITHTINILKFQEECHL